MNRAIRLFLLAALTFQVQAQTGDIYTDSEAASDGPVRLIFDTDMDTDVDDAGALAVLHALADNGEVEILATMVSSLYPWSAPATDAINHYYGRPHLPIGSPKGEGATLDRPFRYARELAEEFPRRLASNDDAADAAKLYRRILASQPDRSVVIVTVGYVTNLRDLLRTAPDESSALNGRDLVAQKVRLWVCMGGAYPAELDGGHFGNFSRHADAAVEAVRGWPTPITFSGLGGDVLTGFLLSETPIENPVRRAYELYLRGRPARPSWDQVAVLYAVRGLGPHFTLQTEGYNHIFEDGTNVWRLAPDREDHRLLELGMHPQELAGMLDELMIQPPGFRSPPSDIYTDPAARPIGAVRLIFDTDMDTDVDDVGALAVLHALADNGEVEILATMVSSRYPWSAPATDAINHYYGRPHLPIGSPKGEGATLDRTFRYAKEIAEEFPHRLRSNDEAPDAAGLYREILASQPDRSVVIVTVGYVTNLWDLLRTEPDEFSALGGRDLVAQKVKLWVCMGGRYPVHLDPRPFGNFKPHPEAAVGAVRDWPTPITFTGIGDEILTGSLLPGTPADNPVRRAYALFLRDAPTRPSWDQVALLYAVRGLGSYFRLQTLGFNHIFEDGTNAWRLSRGEAESRHRLLRLKMDPEELTALIDQLMMQPPRQTGSRGQRHDGSDESPSGSWRGLSRGNPALPDRAP